MVDVIFMYAQPGGTNPYRQIEVNQKAQCFLGVNDEWFR